MVRGHGSWRLRRARNTSCTLSSQSNDTTPNQPTQRWENLGLHRRSTVMDESPSNAETFTPTRILLWIAALHLYRMPTSIFVLLACSVAPSNVWSFSPFANLPAIYPIALSGHIRSHSQNDLLWTTTVQVSRHAWPHFGLHR